MFKDMHECILFHLFLLYNRLCSEILFKIFPIKGNGFLFNYLSYHLYFLYPNYVKINITINIKCTKYMVHVDNSSL